MSLFEVDINALNNLISCLATFDSEIDSIQSALKNAYHNFDSSFVSPDKGNFESNFNELFHYLACADSKGDEIRAGLHNLLVYVQDAENVHF
jgi:hypothetical protein